MVISAGGSGGHLFPAQALAEQLRGEEYEVLFIGNGLAKNPYFKQNDFLFKDIPSATFKGKNPLTYLIGVFKILGGMAKSYWVLRIYKPHVVVGFGSYQTVPALLSAKLLQTPILLHEANAVPGKVNRYLSPYVNRTAVTFEQTCRHVEGESTVVELPLSQKRSEKKVTREEALEYYQLDRDRLTLLIFGGSQGARKLNQLAFEALVEHVVHKVPHLQVLHFTGRGNQCDELSIGYEKAGIPVVLKPFEDHMEYAWTLADFSLSRAGASSIAEQEEYAVPGIFVPFPYATDDHQARNAQAFIETTHGAEMYREKELTPEKLGERLLALCLDGSKRRQMREGIEQYRDSRRTESLLSLVKKLMLETS